MLRLLICRIISVHMDGRFMFVVQLGLGEFQKRAFKRTARVKVSTIVSHDSLKCNKFRPPLARA